jgi:uncharacterized protein (TIGR03000 family)
MPAPRKSGYSGESGAEMPLPGPNGSRRNDRGDDRNATDRDRTSPSDTEKPRTNPPNRNDNPKPPEEVRAPAPATIFVTLPADAALTIDDTPTRSRAALRTFVSPPLDPGQTYHYTLKAEALRGGKAVTANQRIEVRAGRATRVELVLPEPVARR